MKQAFYPISIKVQLACIPFCTCILNEFDAVKAVFRYCQILILYKSISKHKKEPALREGRLYSFNN